MWHTGTGLERTFSACTIMRSTACVGRSPRRGVGGPEIAGGIGDDNWLGEFIDHCLNGTNYATGEIGTPLDFLSWHAKGQPKYTDHVQMNVSTQLDQIDQAFALVSRYPRLRDMPIVLGEYDPDSCAACTSAAYGYRNSAFYSSYTAQSFVRALDLAATHGVNLRGLTTWAFEYEPTKMNPNETALFDGYRVLSTQGVDLAVLNMQRLLPMMSGGERVEATSSGQVAMERVLSEGVRQEVDVGVFASRSTDGKTTYVLVWHYHDDELDVPDVDVTIRVDNLPFGGMANVTEYPVDDHHASAYALWQRMGSPQPPSDEQYGELREAARLAGASRAIKVESLSTPSAEANVRGASLDFSTRLPIRGCNLFAIAPWNL